MNDTFIMTDLEHLRQLAIHGMDTSSCAKPEEF